LNRSTVTKTPLKLAQNPQKRSKSRKKKIIAIFGW